jgi:hypothetical protein
MQVDAVPGDVKTGWILPISPERMIRWGLHLSQSRPTVRGRPLASVAGGEPELFRPDFHGISLDAHAASTHPPNHQGTSWDY